MATNIINKAAEVRWWIEREHRGEAPAFEVVYAHVRKRWPDLDETVSRRIARLLVPPPKETTL